MLAILEHPNIDPVIFTLWSNEAGEPVAGARVSLGKSMFWSPPIGGRRSGWIPGTPSGEGSVGRETFVDEHGAFEMDDVAVGRYQADD